jgi:GT2 family glycosyltransferase
MEYSQSPMPHSMLSARLQMPWLAMPPLSDSRRIYALVLNWNGWADTLLCLESLLRCDGVDLRIVVWDNGSTDHSVERIESWARGELDPTPRAPRIVRDCVQPPTPKPLSCSAVAAGDADPGSRIVVIRGDENLGYAGGNNAAMRWALARRDCAYVWVLNNDIVVAADAPQQMLQALQDDTFDRPVGAHIYYLDEPQRLQACGGQRLGRGPLVAPRYVTDPAQIDFLVGASLFMSRARAQSLGPFNEAYFLNAEDLEYTYPYKREFADRHPGVAPFLVVGTIWHRESASQSRNRFLHTYYFTRNTLHAARKLGAVHGAFTLVNAVARVGLALARRENAAARGIALGVRDYWNGVYGVYRGTP